MRKERPLRLRLGAGGKKAAKTRGPARTSGPAQEDGLLGKLRAWRRKTAAAQGAPPYVVFPDATLLALAEARPASRADLARISGMGEKRIERYGEDILALVRDAAS
ncbi:MAG: hypothetical protein EBZ50_09975 [Alphaproteobacteria bacterium]|nr:hypothetical protein [Alphaproteobacteria bacterium]